MKCEKKGRAGAAHITTINIPSQYVFKIECLFLSRLIYRLKCYRSYICLYCIQSFNIYISEFKPSIYLNHIFDQKYIFGLRYVRIHCLLKERCLRNRFVRIQTALCICMQNVHENTLSHQYGEILIYGAFTQ